MAPDLRRAFRLFAERCAFEQIDDEYFDTDLEASVADYVRDRRKVFTARVALP